MIENIDYKSHIIDLLDQFSKVCNQNEIQYILWGETARSAKVNGISCLNRPYIEVAIMAKDAPLLISELNNLDSDKFKCDSWITNDSYPLFMIRFNDCDTTYLPIDSINGYANKCIHIKIHLLCIDCEKKSISEAINKQLEIGLYYAINPIELLYLKTTIREILIRLVSTIIVVIVTLGKKRTKIAKKLFSSRIKNEKPGLNSVKLYSWTPNTKKTIIDFDLFDNTSMISLDGLECSVPKDFVRYMCQLGNCFWVEKSFEISTQSEKVLFASDEVGDIFIIPNCAFNKRIWWCFYYQLRSAISSFVVRKERRQLQKYKNVVRCIADQYYINNISC